MVFHYDTFTSYGSNQVCEAAYICSSGIPVKVLVSPTNYWRMKDTYENLPGLSSDAQKPEVITMKFQDKHLNVTRMMNLMAVNEKEGAVPLYIEVSSELFFHQYISHCRRLFYAFFEKWRSRTKALLVLTTIPFATR